MRIIGKVRGAGLRPGDGQRRVAGDAGEREADDQHRQAYEKRQDGPAQEEFGHGAGCYGGGGWAASGVVGWGMATFGKDQLKEALTLMGTLAHAEGKTLEIAVYGGSALMLLFDWRQATRDVDAVFEADKADVRRLATNVADALHLPANWINDGVKGFLSAMDRTATGLFATYPSESEPGLRVLVASPDYLFAMKCLAMRTAGVDGNADMADIRALAGELGLRTAEDAFDVVARFYPRTRISPKTQFGLEEIFGDMEAEGKETRP